jgi:hypothetical protein
MVLRLNRSNRALHPNRCNGSPNHCHELNNSCIKFVQIALEAFYAITVVMDFR